MRIAARAKINWTLDILGKRADGYHELDTIMQPLALHDTLDIEPADTLSLTVDGMAADDNNLVLKAARALNRFCGASFGAQIHLIKRIPLGAGLGGGSADAAATLKALNALWNLQLSYETLSDIALSLGADVPFCLLDHTARARGVGERLSPISSRLTCPLVLVQPCGGLLTKDVFLRYTPAPAPLNIDSAVNALERGDLRALAACTGNALTPAAASLQPILQKTIDDLAAHGAVVSQMTGSGSVIFGAFSSNDTANPAYESLKSAYPVVIRTETAE